MRSTSSIKRYDDRALQTRACSKVELLSLHSGHSLSHDTFAGPTPQSDDAQPRQPQFTHSITWLSFKVAFGIRQMHVELKFVSLV